MSDPVREFLAWFDGFAEGIPKRPSEAQWARIVARMKLLAAAHVTVEAAPAPRVPAPTAGRAPEGSSNGPAPLASKTQGSAIIGAASAGEWLERYIAECVTIARSRGIVMSADDQAMFRAEIDAEVYVSTPEAAAAHMIANFSE